MINQVRKVSNKDVATQKPIQSSSFRVHKGAQKQ